MEIRTFFDARTWTVTYAVWDPAIRDAGVIAPVLDFDNASGRIWRESREERRVADEPSAAWTRAQAETQG